MDVVEKIHKLTPRQQKSKQTKEKIYRTAAKMLAKYEFNSITVRNICVEANVSTGTFYHFFNSKEDLWTYFLSDGLEEYAKDREPKYKGDISAYIMDVYTLYLSYCLNMGVEFLAHYYSGTNRQLSRSYDGADMRPVSVWIRAGIEQAKLEGDLPRAVDTEGLIHDVCVIIKGCIFEWCVSEGNFDLISYSVDLIARYMRGLLHFAREDEKKAPAAE